MIDFNDISVIVQGQVFKDWTARGIASVRKKMPGAKVIVCTWEGENTEGLDYDELIILKAPERIKINRLTTVNMQITGKVAALKACKTKYVLINRTDSEIINLNFLSLFERYKEHKFTDMHFLSERIVVTWFTCNCTMHNQFDICFTKFNWIDFYAFGLTEDVLKLYDIPLFIEKDGEDYSAPKYFCPESWLIYNFVGKYLNAASLTINNERFNCEVWFTDNFMKKSIDNVSITNLNNWEKIILENFITAGMDAGYGIRSKKYFVLFTSFFKKLINKVYFFQQADWLYLYNKMYHINVPVGKRFIWRFIFFLRRCDFLRRLCGCFYYKIRSIFRIEGRIF